LGAGGGGRGIPSRRARRRAGGEPERNVHRPESKFPEFARRYPDWILDCSDLTEEDLVWVSPRIETVFPKPVATCQARTSAEVTAHLSALASSVDARVEAGRAALEYAQRHFSPVACAKRAARDLLAACRTAA
jgi:hypothetical protein